MKLTDKDDLYARMMDEMEGTGYQSRALNVIRMAPEIAPPPNPPLTLEELREMEKSPVYLVCDAFPEYTGWHIVDKLGARHLEFQDGLCIRLCDYEKAGLAYRRKPEEGTT